MRRPHLERLPAPRRLPGDPSLRAFEPGDLPGLARLLDRSFDDRWDEARVREGLIEAEDVHTVFVVTYGSEVIATASSQVRVAHSPTSGFVHWVATDPAARGQGYASALLLRVLEDIRDRNYREARLFTQLYRRAAIRAYLRFGFLPVYEMQGRDQQPLWSAIFQTLGG